MKIKIIKCNNNYAWYKDYIGNTYTVHTINFCSKFFGVAYVSEHQYGSVDFEDSEVIDLEGLPLNIAQQPLCGSGADAPTPKPPEAASHSGERCAK